MAFSARAFCRSISGSTAHRTVHGVALGALGAGAAFLVSGLGLRSLAAAEVDEFSGTNLLSGALVLEAIGSAPLIRTNLSWEAPQSLSHPALVFSFGFASDEKFEAGQL